MFDIAGNTSTSAPVTVSQPTVQIADYIKNLKVCAGAGTPAREDLYEEESTIAGISISPNPSEKIFNTLANRDIQQLQITDLQGRNVNIQYADGNRESLKIVKTD